MKNKYTYFAKDNQIFAKLGYGEEAELFLTVHPTEASIPLEAQVEVLLNILNNL